MKKLLSFSLGMLLSASLFGQQMIPWCGTDKSFAKAAQNDPNFEATFHQKMLAASSHISQKQSALYTIPVVVHILHNNGADNISQAQIQDALDVLNIDYNRQNADTSSTRNTPTAPFSPEAGAMDIEFKLAKIDPNGNCTNGIVRVNAPGATFNVDESSQPHKHSALGGSDAWPRDSYFNIWVVNSIGAGGGPTFIAGYAQFPYFGSADEYGLTIMHSMMGTIGTAIGQSGRVLTHEVGHCLGLLHTFQGIFLGPPGGCHDTDCGANGDYCCDTPPQDIEDFTCNQNLNSCSEIPTNDTYGFDALDQIENYMSYNSCQNMFSLDQVNIMESIFVDYPWAADLVSPANALATGVNNPDALCEAEFFADKTTVCAGTQIQFTDLSYSAVTGWDWTFSGGTPPNSTAQNPLVTFNTPGLHEVTLSATDGVNTDVEVKTAYIRVLPVAVGVPYYEDFEGYSNLNAISEWEVINFGGDAAFEMETTTGYTGTKCARILNNGESVGSEDELVSSPIDLTSITGSMTLSFRYAYVRKNASDDDWLRVYVTADCGDTWTIRKTMHGFMLSSITQAAAFTPSSQADWTTVHMTNITNAYWVDNFAFKFAFEAGGGNNFYLDDINIYAGAPSETIIVGIEDDEPFSSFALYPNPVDKELNLTFEIMSANDVDVIVTDVSGKILQKNLIHANEGKNLVLINTSPFSAGTYFVTTNVSGTEITKKFIVQ